MNPCPAPRRFLALLGLLLAPLLGHAAEAAYTVQPGDVLNVSVWREPTLQGPVMVRPDGGFSFPLAGEIDARQKTVADLQKLLSERLKKFISDPVVSVSVTEVKGNKIYVIGQVNRPGEFVMNPSVNVLQALSMAGGTNAFANTGGIMVIRRDAAGQQTSIPFHYADVSRGKNLEQNVQLQSGDIVVVP